MKGSNLGRRREWREWRLEWSLALCPPSMAGYRRRLKNYCVNDGGKLVLIALWALGTIAIFVATFIRTPFFPGLLWPCVAQDADSLTGM